MSTEDPRWPRRPAAEASANAYRSGFGAPRWPESRVPAKDADEPSAGSRAPFGGSGWEHGESDPEIDEGDEEGGRDRTRRRRTPTPSLYPRLTVAALGSKATVRRDANGIAHVTASSERDAYCALGVCMAQDRIWQMDVLRRLAAGRAAELLGPEYARADVLARAAGITRRAAAAASHVDGISREILAAFVGGVNVIGAAASTEETQSLGYAIEPWTIADSLAIEIYFSWLAALEIWPLKLLLARAVAAVGLERARWISAATIPYELASEERVRLFRRIDPRIADLAGTAPRASGGSAWAVSAQQSAGGALLSADRSLAPWLPAPLYLTHLEAPGLSVVGTALAGTPLIQMGRNKQVAWATSPALADDVDVILEELDGIGNYRTEDGWKKFARRKEIVRVRGGDALRFEVAETRNGALFSTVVEQLDGPLAEGKSIGVSLRWGANTLSSAVAGWLAVARATSVQDLAAAAATLDRGPQAQTIVGADAQGSIGKWSVGGLPTRSALARLPVRGWLPESRWGETAPLSSAAAQTATTGAEVLISACEAPASEDEAAYPVWAFAASPHRHDRIRQALGAGTSIDAAACEMLQRDVVDLAAREVQAALLRALDRGADAGSMLARLRDVLAGWDGGAAAESGAAALLYRTLHGHVLPELFSDARYGALAQRGRIAWSAALRILGADTSPWFATAEERDQLLRSALERAANELGQLLGGDPAQWSWGAIHQLRLAHPLAAQEGFGGLIPEWPAPGSSGTVLQHGFEGASLPFEISMAPAARMVADLSQPTARFALSSGQSGRIGSPTFSDQVAAWREGSYLTLSLASEASPTGEITELMAG